MRTLVSPLFPNDSPAPEALDQRVRESLANSLELLHQDDSETLAADGSALADALEQIRAHRLVPGLFGRYYQIVLALQAGDQQTAGRLWRELLALAHTVAEFEVVPFSPEALGDELDRYAYLVDIGADEPALVGPLPEGEWPIFRDNFDVAQEVIELADPRLLAEQRALLVQLIAAAPPANATRNFGGVSSFMLWGAVHLNGPRHPTPIDLAEGLVHETAHHFLFGLSCDEALVENAIEEDAPSPLRQEPRPLDGIYHATFVCARLHYFYQKLLESGRLNEAQAREITQRRDHFRERFTTGTDSLDEYGRLTELGAAVMTQASGYVHSVA